MGNVLVLFDVDDTLTPARRVSLYLFVARLALSLTYEVQDVTPEILEMLQQLRKKVVIGSLGGSNLAKQQEQIGVHGPTGQG